jgi:hypothetical protein
MKRIYRAGLLAFCPTLLLFGSDDEALTHPEEIEPPAVVTNPDECYFMGDRIRETGDGNAFTVLASQIRDATILFEAPILTEDENHQLVILLLPSSIIVPEGKPVPEIERKCLMARDGTDCTYWESTEDGYRRIKLCLEGNRVVQVIRIDSDGNEIVIHGSDLLNKDIKTEPYGPGLSQIIGRPNRMSVSFGKGQMTAKIKTLFQELNDFEQDVANRFTAVDTSTEHIISSMKQHRDELNRIVHYTIKRDFRTFSQQSHDQTDSLLRAMQTSITGTVARQREECDTHTDEALQSLLATISRMVGVDLRQGEVTNGSLVEQITTIFEQAFGHIHLSGRIANSLHCLSDFLSRYGAVPLMYMHSIQAMLYGNTVGHRMPVLTSLSQYALEIEGFLADDYLRKLRIPLGALTQKIKYMVDFFKYTDLRTVEHVLLEVIKLFGNKFPLYSEFSLDIAGYCRDAHFTTADCGFYGWVKDIHGVLQEFKTSRKLPGVSDRAETANSQINKLLKGFPIMGTVLNVQPIPVTHFGGMVAFPEILAETVDMIKEVCESTVEWTLKRQLTELTAEFRQVVARLNEQEARVADMFQRMMMCLPPHVQHHHMPDMLSPDQPLSAHSPHCPSYHHHKSSRRNDVPPIVPHSE